MVDETDSVLMDYLSGLLTPADSQLGDNLHPGKNSTFSLEAQACLQVKVGTQNLLLPLVDLAGMQAICGPLILVGGAHWQGQKHSGQVLLDLNKPLGVVLIPYALDSWQGHSLKLKQTQQSVLVDLIVGPVHSMGKEKWHDFNGVRYTLVIT